MPTLIQEGISSSNLPAIFCSTEEDVYLISIDFGGLSTDPDDVHSLFK
jgi:hypothetical protein